MRNAPDRYPNDFYFSCHCIPHKDFKKLASCEVMIASAHIIERIIRREQFTSLEGTIDILRPLVFASISMPSLYQYRDPSQETVVVSERGLAIFRYDPMAQLPVAITWLPKHWWTPAQALRLAPVLALAQKSGHNTWIAFDSSLYQGEEPIDIQQINPKDIVVENWKAGVEKIMLAHKAAMNAPPTKRNPLAGLIA